MAQLLYFWRLKQTNGRWRKLGWKMTEQGARQWAESQGHWEGRTVELEKVDGSGEQPIALGSTSAWKR